MDPYHGWPRSLRRRGLMERAPRDRSGLPGSCEDPGGGLPRGKPDDESAPRPWACWPSMVRPSGVRWVAGEMGIKWYGHTVDA